MSGVTFAIRAYRPEDFETLWRLDQACFPPGIAYSRMELMTYIRRRNSFALVAECVRSEAGGDDSGDATRPRIAGFIVAESGRRAGHIITIDVREEARRSGLGSRLMMEAEKQLRALGCRAIVLETAVDNAAAIAFYKRLGYFAIKTIPRYYTTGVDAFVLKKELLSPVPAR